MTGRQRFNGDREAAAVCGRERGSIIPIMTAVLTVAVVMMLALVAVGAQVTRRAHAQAAADAAALAGVFEGRAGAADLAERNGATLLAFEAVGSDVRVVVAVEGVTAEARARFDWPSVPASGP